MGDLHGDSVLSPLRVAGVTFLKIFNKNGRLTRGFCSFSVALRWRYFSKNAPQKWAVYTGTPVFFSTPPLVLFLGGGVRFFSAFNAVLFCTFVVCALWAPLVMFFVVFVFGRWGAGLSLPSVGFVNAV